MTDINAVLTGETLRKMGLSEAPKPRYDDLPAPMGSPDISKLVNFNKAKLLVDPLLTAKFTRYIPDAMLVDQQIDSLSYRPDWCFCFHVDTTVPPPVNPKITRVTGIAAVIDDGNFMLWLGREIENHANVLGTFKIGPPQVFRTKEMMGVMVKYDRTPKYGETIHDAEAQIGLLLPQ